MESIDKNDVDISKLFNYGTPVPLKDDFDKNIKKEDGSPLILYIKLIGDADTNRARVYALRKSSEMRKELRTPDSDLRIAYIPDFTGVSKANLIEMVINFNLREYVQEALKSLIMPLPLEPDSGASLEKQEKYQQEVDNWTETREKRIRELIEETVVKHRKYLSSLPKEELALEAENAIINELCEQEMYNSFQSMVLTLGTFNDPEYTQRSFQTPHGFDNLPKPIRDQLLEAYEKINISTEDLKKLPGVTQ